MSQKNTKAAQKQADQLLKAWCDALAGLQIKSPHKGLDGGILCPSCARVHGRCGDAIYPMLYMAKKTGDSRYLDCAKALFLWWDNVSCHDGSYVNDVFQDWKGITVFCAITLSESLLEFGDLLDGETKAAVSARVKECADFILKWPGLKNANINYIITGAAMLAYAHAVLGDDRYLDFADALIKNLEDNFTKNMLLKGEGWKDGKYEGIDLGYNVEESLPSLLQYARLTNNEKLRLLCARALEAHLYFMAPDGGWDNSWGSRRFKWTYWGSRTSDGCLYAYAALSGQNPAFLTAVERNLDQLAKCTHNGILYGGPDYFAHGEQPCIHHTFCHAKAVAELLNQTNYKTAKPENHPLPSEQASGVRYYPEIKTYFVRTGIWNATICNNDYVYQNINPASGGTLSFLYHKTAGPVFAASLTKYLRNESHNMQMPIKFDDAPLTVRVESGEFVSTNDTFAQVSLDEEDGILFTVTGRLRDYQQKGCGISYKLCYRILENRVQIRAEASSPDAKLCVPVICKGVQKDGQFLAHSEKCAVLVDANHPYTCTPAFSYAPGFMAQQITLPADGAALTLTVLG